MGDTGIDLARFGVPGRFVMVLELEEPVLRRVRVSMLARLVVDSLAMSNDFLMFVKLFRFARPSALTPNVEDVEDWRVGEEGRRIEAEEGVRETTEAPRVSVPKSDTAVSSADSRSRSPELAFSTSVPDSLPAWPIVNRVPGLVDRCLLFPANDRLWRRGMTEPRTSPVKAMSKLVCRACFASKKLRLRRSKVESLIVIPSRNSDLGTSGKNRVWFSCAFDRAVAQLSEKTSIKARSTMSL